MGGKRGAENQITKDDPEESDGSRDHHDDEPTAASRMAPPEVLAQRRIVRLGRDAQGRIDVTQPARRVNPFAAVDLTAGLGTSQSTTTATVSTGTAASSNAAAAAPSTAALETVATTNESAASEPKPTAAEDSSKPEEATAAESTSTTTSKPSTTTTTTTGFGGAGGFGSGGTTYKGFAEAFAQPASAVTTTGGGFGATSTSTTTGFGGFTFGSSTATGSTTGFSFGGAGSSANGSSSSAFVFAPAASVDSNDTVEGDATANDISTRAVDLPTEYVCETGEEHEDVLINHRCFTKRWGTDKKVNGGAAANMEPKKAAMSVPPSTQMQSVPGQTETTKPAADTASTTTAAGVAAAETTENGFKWIDVGKGPIKLLQSQTDPSSLRIVQRREESANGRATALILNVILYRECTLVQASDKLVKIIFPVPTAPTPELHASKDETQRSRTYIFKFGQPTEAENFYTKLLTECLANAKSCEVGKN